MVEEVAPLRTQAPRWQSTGQRLCLIVAVLATTLALYAWAGTSSTGLDNAPVLVRSPWSALWVAAAFWLLAALTGRATLRTESERLWRALEALSPALACAVAIALLVCVFRHGSFVAGGPDSSGYVSQAALWARGDISVAAHPLAGVAPWPNADWTFVPLGYCLGVHPGTFAPGYAAGLPLLMALAQRIAGSAAVFTIVPLTGLLLLASTYSIGRRLSGPVGGAMATAVVASSPIVLLMTLHPMSDLPAAAFWVAATAVALRGQPTGPLLAGLLASLAILVRPNLAPVALPLAAFVALRAPVSRATVRALALLGIGLLPGVALTAAIHATFYGSPLRSGYGSLSDIFGWHNVTGTLTAYPARALSGHTALIALGLLAPLLPLRVEAPTRARTASAFLLAMAAAVFLCYALYPPYEEWWYLRFVVGSVVWLLLLTTIVLVWLIQRFPLAGRAPAALFVTAVVAGMLLQRASALGVFASERTERRYLASARWVNEHVPQRAALISFLHSGSLRYYTARPILRWDLLPPHKLDRALRFFREHGYAPYFVLDCDQETKNFAIRFHGQSALAQLDWPPRVRIGHGACVRIFDPADRDRYRAGETLITEQIR